MLKRVIHSVPVFVLVGGLGTRLRSAFSTGPKALAPVSGKPFLEYLLKAIRKNGFQKVVLCVGYFHDKIQSWASDGSAFGLEISYSVEPAPLGTGGALRLAIERFGEGARFVAMNGDSFCEINFVDMFDAHTRSGALATIALCSVENATRYGTVRRDEQGFLTAFSEKVAAPCSGLINAGVYIFERHALDCLVPGRNASLEHDLLPTLVGKNLHGFESNGYFIDIGVPEDLQRAQKELPDIIGDYEHSS